MKNQMIVTICMTIGLLSSCGKSSQSNVNDSNEAIDSQTEQHPNYVCVNEFKHPSAENPIWHEEFEFSGHMPLTKIIGATVGDGAKGQLTVVMLPADGSLVISIMDSYTGMNAQTVHYSMNQASAVVMQFPDKGQVATVCAASK